MPVLIFLFARIRQYEQTEASGQTGGLLLREYEGKLLFSYSRELDNITNTGAIDLKNSCPILYFH